MIASIKSIVGRNPSNTDGSEICWTVSEKVFFLSSFTLNGRNVDSLSYSSDNVFASSDVDNPIRLMYSVKFRFVKT